MIKRLSIKNLAVISELEVTFSPGLNVITGETGSGKSILIDAVGLLVGGRALGDIIRTGEETAVVEGEFFNGAESRLVRRLVRSGGASRAFLDDEPVKLSELESLGAAWVDLHGQHEHQSLLRVPTHLDFLDAYAGLLPDREVLAHTFHHLVHATRELEELSAQVAQDKELHELQQFQLRELEAGQLSLQEEETLSREHALLSQADELHRLLTSVDNRLQKDETAVTGELGGLQRQLERFANISPEIAQLAERLSSLKVELEDLAYETAKYGATVRPNSGRLDEIDRRLGEVEALKRKYGGTVDSALAQLEHLRQAVDRFIASDERVARLKADQLRLQEAYAAECQALSRLRQVAREQLSQAIMESLSHLDMPGTEVDVRLENSPAADGMCIIDGRPFKSDARGYDQVEFFISPNPGEKLRPLARIASGGEVSRIMLGIKSVLAEFDHVGSLIFDEIDSGISGSTAETVGAALQELARSRQVIVITHLPQIAAFGDHHITVSKDVERGRTVSRARVVAGEFRQREIARLLSGAEITTASLEQAAQLLMPAGREPTLRPHG